MEVRGVLRPLGEALGVAVVDGKEAELWRRFAKLLSGVRFPTETHLLAVLQETVFTEIPYYPDAADEAFSELEPLIAGWDEPGLEVTWKRRFFGDLMGLWRMRRPRRYEALIRDLLDVYRLVIPRERVVYPQERAIRGFVVMREGDEELPAFESPKEAFVYLVEEEIGAASHRPWLRFFPEVARRALNSTDGDPRAIVPAMREALHFIGVPRSPRPVRLSIDLPEAIICLRLAVA